MEPFVRLDQTARRRENKSGWLVLYESNVMVLKRSISNRGMDVQTAPAVHGETSEPDWSIADRSPAPMGVERVILSDNDRAPPPLASARPDA